MPRGIFKPPLIAGSTKAVSLTGFKELQKTLEELPIEIAGPIVRQSFRAGAGLVADGAKRRAPGSRRSKSMLGFNRAAAAKSEGSKKSLRKTIAESIFIRTPSRKARARTELIFIVVCRHALAAIFERGTVERVQKKTGRRTGRIQPSPYMRPALDVEGPRAIDLIKSLVLEKVERAAARIAKKNRSA